MKKLSFLLLSAVVILASCSKPADTVEPQISAPAPSSTAKEFIIKTGVTVAFAGDYTNNLTTIVSETFTGKVLYQGSGNPSRHVIQLEKDLPIKIVAYTTYKSTGFWTTDAAIYDPADTTRPAYGYSYKSAQNGDTAVLYFNYFK